MSLRTNCCKKSSLILVLFVMAVLAAPAFAQGSNTCLQNEYNLVNKQKLNCTANDVSIAQVTNIRDPLTGAALTTCINGALFNFIADFEIKTTSAQARENIGLYISTNSQTQALTGSCVDNIISQQHQCPNAKAGILCGSDVYNETDASPDNCGDTSKGDNGAFGPGTEKVTLEIDNFLCEAPAGSNQVQLPNCTSWQIPGGTIQCVSAPPTFQFPFNGPGGTPTAIPGSPSKCNCGIIPLGITVQTPSITVLKSCNTADSLGTGLTSCDMTLPHEGGTATYHVDITNTSNFGSIVVDQICDSAYGDIFTVSGYAGAPCAAGTIGSKAGTSCSALTIASGTTGSCDFTADQAEDTTVTNTVSVKGHGSSAGNFGPSTSNSVTVTSHEAPTTGKITKSFIANEAGCATVRYGVEVKNTSAAGTDETLSLNSLSDTAFGSITTVHGTGDGAVLGTTCGVADGLGTLAGTGNGPGVLPAAIPVNNGSYTCQFDGQFCSGLDGNGCFSHTNTVSATLTGDEGASDVVSLTPGSLTLKECLVLTP